MENINENFENQDGSRVDEKHLEEVVAIDSEGHPLTRREVKDRQEHNRTEDWRERN